MRLNCNYKVPSAGSTYQAGRRKRWPELQLAALAFQTIALRILALAMIRLGALRLQRAEGIVRHELREERKVTIAGQKDVHAVG